MPDLASALSLVRLERYPGMTLDEKLVSYRWNVELCRSLYPTMHYFEIALRNRMHAAFTTFCGTELWWEDSRLVRHRYARDEVTKALESVKSRESVPGDVVARVTFGFWRGFYFDRYEQLWRKVIRDVYPHIPRSSAKRSVLNTRVETFRRIRNRVAHHEPIFHLRNLMDVYEDTVETLGWLSSSALAELRKVDDFSTVLTRGPGA